MTDYTIPCDTFVRLAILTHNDLGGWFGCVLIDNGVAVATDRKFLAAEHIGDPVDEPIYVIPDPALIEQCRKEAEHGGCLTITVTPELRYAVAKTTFGYVHVGNCVRWSDEPNPDFSQWRKHVERCRERTPGNGALFFNVVELTRLAMCAPSACVVFEDGVELTGRPMMVRDPHDSNWLGVFSPWPKDQSFTPAVFPGWIK